MAEHRNIEEWLREGKLVPYAGAILRRGESGIIDDVTIEVTHGDFDEANLSSAIGVLAEHISSHLISAEIAVQLAAVSTFVKSQEEVAIELAIENARMKRELDELNARILAIEDAQQQERAFGLSIEGEIEALAKLPPAKGGAIPLEDILRQADD